MLCHIQPSQTSFLDAAEAGCQCSQAMHQCTTVHNPSQIPFVFPGLDRVHCLFTTRWGGHCPQDQGTQPQRQERIHGLQADLGIPSWRDMHQVHGTDLHRIFDPALEYAQGRPKADALATDLEAQALVVSVADCQPLLVTHIAGRFIAALHVGWRANRAKAPCLWVEHLCRSFDASPEEIMAVRGPSLGPGKSEFINFHSEWGPQFTPYFHPGTQSMDLWTLTRDQLQSAGLPANHIFSLDLCTHSLPHLFYSYRRDKSTGRQAGIIWIEGHAPETLP